VFDFTPLADVLRAFVLTNASLQSISAGAKPGRVSQEVFKGRFKGGFKPARCWKKIKMQTFSLNKINELAFLEYERYLITT